MKISQDVKESAVALIFRQNKVTHENGRLLLSDIAADWSGMSMRKEDLGDGVRELLSSGVLVNDRYEGVEGLTLTGLGVDYLGESGRQFSGLVNQADVLLTLNRARHRKPVPHASDVERRRPTPGRETHLDLLNS